MTGLLVVWHIVIERTCFCHNELLYGLWKYALKHGLGLIGSRVHYNMHPDHFWQVNPSDNLRKLPQIFHKPSLSIPMPGPWFKVKFYQRQCL